MSINSVALTGRLGRDCELHTTSSGFCIATFSIAVSERAKNNQTQEWEDYTNWIDCKLFGKRAESISQYLRKGQQVGVVGRLHWSSWEKDGQKRSRVEVIVNDIELLGGTRSSDDNQPATGHSPQSAPQVETFSDADLPF